MTRRDRVVSIRNINDITFINLVDDCSITGFAGSETQSSSQVARRRRRPWQKQRQQRDVLFSDCDRNVNQSVKKYAPKPPSDLTERSVQFPFAFATYLY